MDNNNAGAEDSRSFQQTDGEQRGYSPECGCYDDFAFLSLDIVADVLGPQAELSDCVKFSFFNSCWGDLVRSCKFQIDHFDSKENEMRVEFKIAAIQKTEERVPVERFLAESDYLDVVLNDPKLHFRCIPREAVKVSRGAAGTVKLECDKRFLGNKFFGVLLENPHVHSVELSGLYWDSFNAVVDFCLSLKPNNKTLTFRHDMFSGWPSSLDEFMNEKGFIDNNLNECRCRVIYNHYGCGRIRVGSLVHQIWQRVHPEDSTKVLEVLVHYPPVGSAAGKFAEVRLYSHGIRIEDLKDITKQASFVETWH